MCKDSIAGLCKEADILKEIFFIKRKNRQFFLAKKFLFVKMRI